MQTLTPFIVLFFTSHLCLAQNGYTYPRPPDGLLTKPSTTIPGVTPPLRPGTAGGYPTSIGSGFPGSPGFSTTTPAYGGTGFPASGRPTGIGFPSGSGVGTPGFGTTPAIPGFPGRPGATAPITSFPPAPGVTVRPGTGSEYPIVPNYPSGSRPGFSTGQSGNVGEEDYEGGDYSAIPGEPGVDYPIYSNIPQTSFDCNQQQWPGYYADVEVQCQVFHICALNRTYDFLCPNGTIFSQEHLVCVWWNQFDCSTAPSLYGNNAFIYDYSQTGQSVQPDFSVAPGGPVGIPSGNARPPILPGYPGTGRPTGPAAGYPGTGRPTSSGGVYPIPARPQGPSVTYPPQSPPASYPGSTGPSVSYPGAQVPTGSTGGFPGGVTSSTVPTTAFPVKPGSSILGFPPTSRPGFPIQGDTPFPASPQTPNREYLPPRRE